MYLASILRDIPYSGEFSWVLIFVESPKRSPKLIFMVLNFVAAISSGAWHPANADVIAIHALAIFFAYYHKDLDK